MANIGSVDTQGMSKTSIPSRRELEKMGPVYEGLLEATDRARLALDHSAATLARANELAQGFTPKTAAVKNEIAAARAKHATCAQSLETARAEARRCNWRWCLKRSSKSRNDQSVTRCERRNTSRFSRGPRPNAHLRRRRAADL